jgi:hypothetical protein
MTISATATTAATAANVNTVAPETASAGAWCPIGEHREPAALRGILALAQAVADRVESALEAPSHRAVGDAVKPSDLGARHPLEVVQQQRRAIGFVERHDLTGYHAL